jgi:hypothetical protein
MASSKRWGKGIQVSTTLKGGEDLLRKLKGLGLDAQKVADVATREAMEVSRAKIEADAPGPGIVMAPDKSPAAGVAVFVVGPDKDHWYYQFFETGVSAFEINMVKRRTKRTATEKKSGKRMRGRRVRSEGSVLAFEASGGVGGAVVFAKRVQRGPMAAQPFMRRNFLGSENPMKDKFGYVFSRAVIAKYLEGA